MCDHDPNDDTVLRQPAAPISPQDIAEMRMLIGHATDPDSEFVRDVLRHGLCFADAEFYTMARTALPRLLDAIEALTASVSAIGEAFGCHPDSTPQEVAATVIKRAEELKAGALAELAAENARLKSVEELFNGGVRFNPASFRQEVMGWVRAEKDRAEKAVAERDALKAEVERLERRLSMKATALGYWQRMAHRFRELLCDEKAVATVSREDWYAAERQHFETAYLARLQANCTNCRGGKPNHVVWPDIHVCPICHRDCRPDASEGN